MADTITASVYISNIDYSVQGDALVKFLVSADQSVQDFYVEALTQGTSNPSEDAARAWSLLQQVAKAILEKGGPDAP